MEDTYCVIIGKELGFECEVEICEGYHACPYIDHKNPDDDSEED